MTDDKIIESMDGGHYCEDCFNEQVQENEPSTHKRRDLSAGICGHCGYVVMPESLRLAERCRHAAEVVRCCASSRDMRAAICRQGLEPPVGLDGLVQDLRDAAALLESIEKGAIHV